MIRVLKSVLFRIKSRPFISGALLLLPFFIPFLIMINTHIQIKNEMLVIGGKLDPREDYSFLIYLIAAFTVLLLDSDLRQGGVRNKVTSGTRRHHIYLGNLLVSCVYAAFSSCMYFLSWKVFFLITGDTGRKEYYSPDPRSCLIILLWTLAFSCIFVLIEHYFSYRIFSAFLCFIMLIAVNCVGDFTYDRLYEPYKEHVVDEITGEDYYELNPKYVTGTKRKIYTLIERNVPQSAILERPGKRLIKEQSITTLGLMFITTATGVITFRRKDLE